jgi:hypothetical protein
MSGTIQHSSPVHQLDTWYFALRTFAMTPDFFFPSCRYMFYVFSTWIVFFSGFCAFHLHDFPLNWVRSCKCHFYAQRQKRRRILFAWMFRQEIAGLCCQVAAELRIACTCQWTGQWYEAMFLAQLLVNWRFLRRHMARVIVITWESCACLSSLSWNHVRIYITGASCPFCSICILHFRVCMRANYGNMRSWGTRRCGFIHRASDNISSCFKQGSKWCALHTSMNSQPSTYEQTESSKHLWNQDEGLAIIRRAFTYLHASGAGGCGQGRPVWWGQDTYRSRSCWLRASRSSGPSCGILRAVRMYLWAGLRAGLGGRLVSQDLEDPKKHWPIHSDSENSCLKNHRNWRKSSSKSLSERREAWFEQDWMTLANKLIQITSFWGT